MAECDTRADVASSDARDRPWRRARYCILRLQHWVTSRHAAEREVGDAAAANFSLKILSLSLGTPQQKVAAKSAAAAAAKSAAISSSALSSLSAAADTVSLHFTIQYLSLISSSNALLYSKQRRASSMFPLHRNEAAAAASCTL
jgi:hypothetical protein